MSKSGEKTSPLLERGMWPHFWKLMRIIERQGCPHCKRRFRITLDDELEPRVVGTDAGRRPSKKRIAQDDSNEGGQLD